MGLALDEPKENDRTYKTDGITWLVAGDDHDQIVGSGLEVDHISGWFGSGFTVLRKGAAASCC